MYSGSKMCCISLRNKNETLEKLIANTVNDKVAFTVDKSNGQYGNLIINVHTLDFNAPFDGFSFSFVRYCLSAVLLLF